MKKILSILALALGFVALWSCGSDDPVEPDVDVRVRATSITPDEEVDAKYTQSVTLTYSAPVAVSSSANITLNGHKVEAHSSNSSTMDVVVSLSLEPDNTYTLTIPNGSVTYRGSKKSAMPYTLKFRTRKVAEDPNEDDEPNAALRMARVLGFGWNLGNHFDTGANSDANGKPIDFEKPKWGYWDGAKPTEQLYRNLVELGIKSVRIPVTWGVWQANDGAYTISEKYMAEVEQNVLWALNAGLYVVLNTHHDEYWQDIINAVINPTLNATIEDRFTKTWTQIANRFEACGDHLIFETMNEVHDDSWGWKGGYNYRPVYTMMNEWNKVCVDAIRATGGNNAIRWIGIPGFCANPSFTIDYLTIPNGDKRIMVAVHCYDPFDFTTQATVPGWGHKYKGNDNDENQIQQVFKKLHDKYIAKEIPCYMGEYGAVTRKSSADEKYRKYYLEYFTRCAYLNHIPMMLWDNNSNSASGERFYFINHNDGTCFQRDLIRMMVNAATNTNAGYTLKSIYDSAQ